MWNISNIFENCFKRRIEVINIESTNDTLNIFLQKYGHRVFSIRNKPDDSIYIGRGKNSIFGNPFAMKSEEDRIEVCLKYKDFLIQQVKKDFRFKEEVKGLHNKNVYCFCSNGKSSLEEGAKYCHGHVLLACADILYNKKI